MATISKRLASHGVLFDDLLLLKPDLLHKDSVRAKIATSLADVRQSIDRARAAGKHVLYLPGSYDVVHLGHAFHIEQAVVRYLQLPEHHHLTANDLYVLVLADDDDLIASMKASKHVSRGGSEAVRRPIQCHGAYRGDDDVFHWRLFELASLPRVDGVGFIPSPMQASSLATSDIMRVQRNPDDLPALLAQFRIAGGIPEADLGSLEASIGQYRDLLRLLVPNPDRVRDAFCHGLHPWSIQSWQLFIHCYLGAGEYAAPIVRVMSHQDDIHGYQVGFIMHAAGIQTCYLNEETLVTTSGLLKEYGPEALLAAKRTFYV